MKVTIRVSEKAEIMLKEKAEALLLAVEQDQNTLKKLKKQKNNKKRFF